MSTTPSPDLTTLVALVERDIAAAVDTAAKITSPYFAHARLDTGLTTLLRHMNLLVLRRPELAADLAAHLGHRNHPDDVHAAVKDRAARDLEARLDTQVSPGRPPHP